jgi:hypothetical protein
MTKAQQEAQAISEALADYQERRKTDGAYVDRGGYIAWVGGIRNFKVLSKVDTGRLAACYG